MSSSEPSSSAGHSSGAGSSSSASFNNTDAEDSRPKKSKIDAFYSDFNINQPSTSTVRCLLCSFAHIDARTVEEHMNSVHFDLGDSSTTSTVEQEPTFGCPICPEAFPDAKTLKTHVNRNHKDVLSPIKVNPEAKKSEPVDVCPICSTSFNSAQELIQHVDTHFSNRDQTEDAPNTACDRLIAEQISASMKEKENQEEKREFEFLKARYGMNDKGDFKEQSTSNMQRAVRLGQLALSDYFEKQSELRSAEYRGVDDGSSCVRDVIPRVREKSRTSINVAETHLCNNVDFYGAAYGDRGWGCGYRNMQMLLSALSRCPTYVELLKKHVLAPNSSMQKSAGNFMPSISKLQEMIEWAWEQGFDVQGCEQLGGKLCSTRKWIGATEVTALLSSMRIKCELVDTMRPSVAKLHYRMFQWIISYFKKKDTFKPPLYLQHKGHSRTIIGVEILKDGDPILLILDPGIESHKIENMLTSSNPFSTLKLLRHTLSSMKYEQYQIVSVCGVLDSEEEYEASKVLRSTRIQ